MPAFTKDALDDDPEGAALLYEILHGHGRDRQPTTGPAATLPILEERFGPRPAAQVQAKPKAGTGKRTVLT